MEIRTVETKRFPVMDPDSWDRFKKSAEASDISLSAVSPGLFKVPLRSDLFHQHSNGLLDISLDLAERMEISTLITFGVQRSPEDTPADLEKIINTLGETSDRAEKRGFSVQLENIPGSWADTGDNCLALLEGVGRSNFGYVWDTGNLYESEAKHFQESYDKLKPFIRNVHLKDGEIIDGEMVWKQFGTGVTDIAGQVAALKTDNYKGTLTMEAKCIPHTDDDFLNSVRYLKSVL